MWRGYPFYDDREWSRLIGGLAGPTRRVGFGGQIRRVSACKQSSRDENDSWGGNSSFGNEWSIPRCWISERGGQQEVLSPGMATFDWVRIQH
jgi:hypothetical protein